jgi:hypothetical protein
MRRDFKIPIFAIISSPVRKHHRTRRRRPAIQRLGAKGPDAATKLEVLHHRSRDQPAPARSLLMTAKARA